MARVGSLAGTLVTSVAGSKDTATINARGCGVAGPLKLPDGGWWSRVGAGVVTIATGDPGV